MEDAPLQRSQRTRRAPVRFETSDDEAEARDPTSSKAHPSLTAKGRKSSQTGRGRSSSARRSSVAKEWDSSDSDDVSSESADHDSSEDEEDDTVDVQPRKRRAASAGAAPSVYR